MEVVSLPDPYLKREHDRFTRELEVLKEYPPEELATIIGEVGFSCTRCGMCCTTGHNGHVFLLDEDTDRAKVVCPQALIPAPFFEAGDRDGNLYVSGYALRTRTDGSCINLTDTGCQIYQDRFSICRVYPYMLHREPDERGDLTFRQISGLNEHGEYHHLISTEESLQIASETIAYETAWLLQMIHFFEDLERLFTRTGQRHVRKVYDQRMRAFHTGEPITVFVYYNRGFIPIIVKKQDYMGMIP